MIFEESTKSYIDSTSFHENKIFRKSTYALVVSIGKKEAEGEYEFLKKTFSYKFVESMPIFALW